MKSRIKLLYEDKNFSIIVYYPSIFKLFIGNLRIINLHEAIRFYMALICGYRIYHLFAKEEEVGYCVVANGGSFRYPFATRKDIIIGPYFIKENYRGNRLSIFLVNKCITEFEKEYEFAYDFIQKDNILSIRTTERCGFHYVCDGEYTKYLRILKPSKNNEGNMVIYDYKSK